METENVIENAQNKFFKKNCDLLVVNDLFEDGAGFKTDTNKVALITKKLCWLFRFNEQRRSSTYYFRKINES